MNASGFAREQIVHVVVFDVGRDRLAVAVQMIGVLPVRVTMIEKAERVVEPLLVRLAGRARAAESPLADDRRAIAGVAQHLGHRHVLGGRQRDLAVAANPRVAGMQAGHQRGARRRADGAAGVVLREPHALARQPIERRRLETAPARTR